jgi:pimeloyl-ACP methyl ester carboxylesterase
MMSFAVNSPAPGEAVDGRLGAITIPTLVVWGQYDGLLPLADGRFYAAGIPHAKLVVVPNAGHAPMIEQPAGFLAALAGFL